MNFAYIVNTTVILNAYIDTNRKFPIVHNTSYYSLTPLKEKKKKLYLQRFMWTMYFVSICSCNHGQFCCWEHTGIEISSDLIINLSNCAMSNDNNESKIWLINKAGWVPQLHSLNTHPLRTTMWEPIQSHHFHSRIVEAPTEIWKS